MIIRARAVVTMDGAPIENGAVAIEGNKIAAVGEWRDVRAGRVGEVLDLGERALLPGLINSHCHLDYTMLRSAIPAQPSFTAWIQSINERKASFTPEDYVRSIETGFAEAANFGTTTIANLEAFPELLPRISATPLRTWWFAEMIDVRAPVSVSAVHAELERAWQAGGNRLGGIGLAPHAPYTASTKLYAETAALAASKKMLAMTHLAESAEEMEMFRWGRGALFEFMQGIGRPMSDCGQSTPLALWLENGSVDERWIVTHLNELGPNDLELLLRAPRFHVAHCPRSHAYFRHSPFRLRPLRDLGYGICLGTDSLASNRDLSLFAEMQQLRRTEPSLRAQEILAMATVNGAAALCQAHALGRIRPGYLADLIAVPCEGLLEGVPDEIVAFGGPVPWLMVDGSVVRGS